jgi:hypothetical protein
MLTLPRRTPTTAEEEHNHCPAEGISALMGRYSNNAVYHINNPGDSAEEGSNNSSGDCTGESDGAPRSQTTNY